MAKWLKFAKSGHTVQSQIIFNSVHMYEKMNLKRKICLKWFLSWPFTHICQQ